MRPHGQRAPTLQRVAGHQDCAICLPPDAHPARARRADRAAIAEGLAHADADEPDSPRCAHCGGTVCTFEDCDCGNGGEMVDGRWACSEPCWAALAGAKDAEDDVTYWLNRARRTVATVIAMYEEDAP